jgi:hypothetical protein
MVIVGARSSSKKANQYNVIVQLDEPFRPGAGRVRLRPVLITAPVTVVVDEAGEEHV